MTGGLFRQINSAIVSALSSSQINTIAFPLLWASWKAATAFMAPSPAITLHKTYEKRMKKTRE